MRKKIQRLLQKRAERSKPRRLVAAIVARIGTGRVYELERMDVPELERFLLSLERPKPAPLLPPVASPFPGTAADVDLQSDVPVWAQQMTRDVGADNGPAISQDELAELLHPEVTADRLRLEEKAVAFGG